MVFLYKGSGCGFPPASSLPERLYSTKRVLPAARPGGHSHSDAVQAGAAKTVYHAAVAAHLHKAARHLRHRIRVGDAGLLRPACGWCQRDDTVSTRSFCAPMKTPHAPVANRTMVSTRYDDDGAADAALRTRPAASRYSTRPAESVFPVSAECPPRRILLMNGSPLQIILHTLQKTSPLRAESGPGRLRSRLARMAGISVGSSRPAPGSHKVPARIRTILYR